MAKDAPTQLVRRNVDQNNGVAINFVLCGAHVWLGYIFSDFLSQVRIIEMLRQFGRKVRHHVAVVIGTDHDIAAIGLCLERGDVLREFDHIVGIAPSEI
jgi:hypothetical protein